MLGFAIVGFVVQFGYWIAGLSDPDERPVRRWFLGGGAVGLIVVAAVFRLALWTLPSTAYFVVGGRVRTRSEKSLASRDRRVGF